MKNTFLSFLLGFSVLLPLSAQPAEHSIVVGGGSGKFSMAIANGDVRLNVNGSPRVGYQIRKTAIGLQSDFFFSQHTGYSQSGYTIGPWVRHNFTSGVRIIPFFEGYAGGGTAKVPVAGYRTRTFDASAALGLAWYPSPAIGIFGTLAYQYQNFLDRSSLINPAFQAAVSTGNLGIQVGILGHISTRKK